MARNDYGKSAYYLDDSGKSYFQWQNTIGSMAGKIEARKFAPYICADDIVMDFGCGGGHLLASIPCKGKFGIELNPHAREAANKYGFPVYEDCTPIEKGSITIAISNHCLEHVPYPIEALRQIKDCLVTNGKLILCVPLEDWRTEKRYLDSDINHHLYAWTPLLLGNCIKEAGFKVGDIQILTQFWSPKIPYFAELPLPLFNMAAYAASVVLKSRQMIAIAAKK